ncbi:hypothetical protein [Paraburkholderia diazotrophica]|uniref:hypothetical protein n=1 Tax=Paraburkholderia diazotrophica TaxID=667676 RepID=UPI00115FE85F|nr:hypothetical protein [Paraburkholderia diazotrophica]
MAPDDGNPAKGDSIFDAGDIDGDINSARFWRNMSVLQPSSKVEAGVANFPRLDLLCRLFLGLFVGFFCVTAALFSRYIISADQSPQVTVVQSKSASQALSGGASAVPLSSAAQHPSSTTPSRDAEEKTLIASSTSTIVTFIAAAVISFLTWRKDRARASKSKRDASR